MAPSSEAAGGKGAMGTDGLTCSVVVCTRDRAVLLDSCLAHLRRLTYPPAEIVVVDSCSDAPGTREIADRWGARYVRASRPGLSHARNVGVRAARSEIVAFIDDDAVAHPEWMGQLVSEFQDPGVTCVTGRTVPPDGIPADHERLCTATQGGRAAIRPRGVVDATDPEWFEITNFGGLGIGTNMAFRRSVLETVQFDEALGRGTAVGGGDENDVYFRLVEAGHRIAHQPSAIVVHPVENTASELWRRFVLSRASATAYVTKLFVEHPRYRTRLINYLLQAVFGKRRTFRSVTTATTIWWRLRPSVVLAYASGPFRYLHGRRVQRSRTAALERECSSDA